MPLVMGFLNVFSDNSEDLNHKLRHLLSDKIARHKIGKNILKYHNVCKCIFNLM